MKKRFLTLFSAAAALLLWSSVLQAAVVGSVRFEQTGSQHLPEEQLKSRVQLIPGMEFRRELLDADVKRLYESGTFADIVSEVQEDADGRMAILFRVRLKPRISVIKYEGNVKYPAKDLAEHVKLEEGGFLRDKDLTASLEALREFYHKNGYADATVSMAILPEKNDQVQLTFKIDEQLKQRVNDVKFEGAKLFTQYDLRHSIANQFSYMNYLPFLNDYLNMGLLDRAELDLDCKRLEAKYHDKGYLDFKIEDLKLQRQSKDPEKIDITFKIFEGEPYKVGKITVTGASVIPVKELTPRIRLKTGETFSAAAETASVKAITAAFEPLGYADFACRAIRKADYKKHVVDVEFQIAEGRQYTVRDVVITGNTGTKEKVIRRELVIQPGDPVDRNRIEVSKQRLMGMGYFKKVEATAVGADAVDEKDVQFKVEEKEQRYNFRLGAGLSDTNGFFGMAEVSADNFDITDPKNWFYGGGQRVRLQGIIGVENAGFNIDFVDPWFLDLPLRFELSGYINRSVFENWNENRTGVRFSLGRRVLDNFTTVTIGYKFEYAKLSDVDDCVNPYLKSIDGKRGFFLSQPSIMIARDTRDSLTDPTSGYNLNLFASITPKALGSTENFYRLELKGSYYYSFFDKAIVTMIGGRIGTIAGFGDTGNSDIPVFERYFLGGSGSLRGFEYRTVSPTVGDGENIGGNTMVQLTAEITHPIWGPLRGVIFCDAGNVWADSFSFSGGGFNVGVGYGIRFKIPQINAPIELDLAYPIVNDQDHESSKLRFHFNMGFTF